MTPSELNRSPIILTGVGGSWKTIIITLNPNVGSRRVNTMAIMIMIYQYHVSNICSNIIIEHLYDYTLCLHHTSVRYNMEHIMSVTFWNSVC